MDDASTGLQTPVARVRANVGFQEAVNQAPPFYAMTIDSGRGPQLHFPKDHATGRLHGRAGREKTSDYDQSDSSSDISQSAILEDDSPYPADMVVGRQRPARSQAMVGQTPTGSDSRFLAAAPPRPAQPSGSFPSATRTERVLLPVDSQSQIASGTYVLSGTTQANVSYQGPAPASSFATSRRRGRPSLNEEPIDWVLWDPTLAQHRPFTSLSQDNQESFQALFRTTMLTNDNRRKIWKRFTREPENKQGNERCLAFSLTIKTDNQAMKWNEDRHRACIKCTKLKRPCASLVLVDDEYKLVWYPLEDQAQSSTDWRDTGFWVR
ncbi:hypothetical protein K491DRAFT_318001 [Lophiostoma macrostomum CBS 122681]|uniref:Uncharacterized protein n=1 Tax=Lophiostoma macrostomum CBS 122681 TaxID=1314788 RepID=A0A6A6TG45_9PLEO|nr:hypothetical protein K491DRAFT_318001 [Lophiostoma macrostomum CBS 122681]